MRRLDSLLKVERHKPALELKHLIDNYWSATNVSQEVVQLPIVPSPKAHIVFKQGNISLFMMMNSLHAESVAPKDCYFGVEFRPYVLGMICDGKLGKYDEQVLPLEQINKQLYIDLNNIFHEQKLCVDTLNAYFSKYFSKEAIDKRVIEAVGMIEKVKGDLLVSRLSDHFEIGTKHVTRIFSRHLGVTPKQFANVVRFSNAHGQLKNKIAVPQPSKEVVEGFYDQSHFNREYKRLTGQAPSSPTMSVLYNTTFE